MNKESHVSSLLAGIESPSDLRALPEHELPKLAEELRRFIISTISSCGGHFAANLGTVELTVALHYVYNTPEDMLVWDVGHQCYAHKVLTGRRDQLHSIRSHGGLAPFLKRGESEYDCFGGGHSSTSISAALGMALGHRLAGNDRRCVAIIGDGGMTAGMAFEALNHAGDLHPDMLVVLNDNEMSISPNVGALAYRMAQIMSGNLYDSIRERGKQLLERSPRVRDLAKRTEEHVKGILTPPGALFEALGFNYIGPVDGHCVKTLVATARQLRGRHGPQLLHVMTKKGKGYAPAEADPVLYHGVGKFDPEAGIVKEPKPKPKKSYSAVFGRWLCDMAEQNDKLVGITPAMSEGSGMVDFKERFAQRFHDVGIAEQHSITLAAGMAVAGYRPVVAIYSTFLQRAYDQWIHDVLLQNLPVMLAIDRAGLVGADGPTHNGSYDLSFLRCLPNMVLMAPADERECRQMLSTGLAHNGPSAVRYPRGNGPGVAEGDSLEALPLGQAEVRRQGKDMAILAFGTMVNVALQVADDFNATVVNMRFVKPLDVKCILDMADSHKTLVCTEENVVAGGAGSAVNECLAAHGFKPAALHGLSDSIISHGSREDMLAEAGVDAAGLARFLEKCAPGGKTGK